jgi:16S rRNA (cytosine1402-N4)-methyltransferase
VKEESPVKTITNHIPVMVHEVCEFLQADRGGVFLDATFGGGSHSKAILEANDRNEIWALDRDPEAEVRAMVFRENYPNRFHFYRKNFSAIDELPKIFYDGALMDLGVSSFQLEALERGFSFRSSSILDMRMDPTSGISAEIFLATASREKLIEAIRDFGEEKYWEHIVSSILSHRGLQETKRSDLLAKLIISCYPLRERFRRIHPATKTFQGIRIAVNQELLELQQALPKIFTQLKIGGHLAIISFHSLEDRIVKQFFKEKAVLSIPKLGTCIPTKKIISPSKEEVVRNPRSRSAKLRILKKL